MNIEFTAHNIRLDNGTLPKPEMGEAMDAYPWFVSDRRESAHWASWDNRRSFWIQREYLLQAIREAGFDLVMEQFDGLGLQIADSMLHGFYRSEHRGTFIGVKTRSA